MRCDNGTAVNCVVEAVGCSTADGWVLASETRQDHFETKCQCDDYVQWVICLVSANSNDNDYACVPDYLGCNGTQGNLPAFIPVGDSAINKTACDLQLTWDICADEYDAICILHPLDCPLGYNVSVLPVCHPT
jgi:hypothetical protein